jgi:hypothetical protein
VEEHPPSAQQHSSIYGIFDEGGIGTMVWKITNHPSYGPVFTPGDFHFFRPMKVHLRGQKFETDNELDVQLG